MTNRELLNERIDASGFKRQYIAEQLGITRESLGNKIAGRSEFVASEIKTLCKLLRINNADMKRIFFAG
jgi:hypothetical protein